MTAIDVRPRRPPIGRSIARALLRRCPICGGRKIFTTYFRLAERCPTCGYPFEREEGYWVGALIVNITVAETWFAILFIATLLLTLPDVAWQPLLIVALVTNGILPIVFYPFSKTLWMALDLFIHPSHYVAATPARDA